MSFNPDPTKLAQDVIFSRKLKTVPHPSITFNNNLLTLCLTQKRLALILDSNMTFNHILSKVHKSIGLLPEFQPFYPKSSLLTVNKTFICSYLDYAGLRFTKNLSRFNTMLHWQ